MNMFDIQCPRCHKVVTKSNLTGSKSALSCSSCHIRFDITVSPLSSKTGSYSVTNIRSF